MRDLYHSKRYTGYREIDDSGPDDGSKNFNTLKKGKRKITPFVKMYNVL
jgi:hypothetical protein